MRTFSFYFHSGALAQPIRRHRAHLGTVSTTCVRVVMQRRATSLLRGRGAGGEGRAGATTRLRSVTTPLFIATQPNPPTEPVRTSYGRR